jgi:hypothetical protein
VLIPSTLLLLGLVWGARHFLAWTG